MSEKQETKQPKPKRPVHKFTYRQIQVIMFLLSLLIAGLLYQLPIFKP